MSVTDDLVKIIIQYYCSISKYNPSIYISTPFFTENNTPMMFFKKKIDPYMFYNIRYIINSVSKKKK